MQPPETEPVMLPSASMPRWLPTGLGEDPHVETTVAMAASTPPSSQPIRRAITAPASPGGLGAPVTAAGRGPPEIEEWRCIR